MRLISTVLGSEEGTAVRPLPSVLCTAHSKSLPSGEKAQSLSHRMSRTLGEA